MNRVDDVRLSVVALAGCTLLIGGLLACVNSAATPEQLRTRVAYDFDCPENQLALQQLDDRTYGVTGCGRRGTYVESCDGRKGDFGTKCTWVLNVDVPPPR